MAWDDFSEPVGQAAQSSWDSFSEPVGRKFVRQPDALDDPNMAVKGNSRYNIPGTDMGFDLPDWAANTLAGMGGSFHKAGRALGVAGNPSENEATVTRRDAPLMDTSAGYWGGVAGDVAKYAPATLAATAASPVALPALVAGAIGFATTPGSVEDRAIAGATDAAMGYGAGKLVQGAGAVVKKIGNKVSSLSAARKAVGDIIGEANIPAATRILDAAPDTVSAEQALVGMGNPNVANLAKITRWLSPQMAEEYAQIQAMQAAARRGLLEGVAGATNQTMARDTSKAMKDAVSSVTVPAMKTELAAANTAGTVGRQLQSEADRFAQAASGSVDDVRRISGAQQKAEELAQAGYGTLANNVPRDIGMPRISGKYSYPGELVDVAEGAAQKAADASIPLGDAARFAQRRADSLAAYGLNPLDTNRMVGVLESKLADPKIGPSTINSRVLGDVAEKIKEWTARNGGVIDADALYTIRKSAVGDTVESLLGATDPKAKAKRAAQLLGEVTPMIDDAIKKAGGTGWKEYLDAHTAGMHAIEQQKMGAKLLGMLDTSPKKVVSIVTGNEPKQVEKVFGPGRYDISKEMGSDIKPLKEVSAQLQREATLSQHRASDGSHQAVVDAVKQDSWLSRITNLLWRPAMIANAALKEGESKANAAMMAKLATAMDNPKALSDLLKTLPVEQRNRAVKMINQISPAKAAVYGATLSDLVRQQ